MTSTIDELKKEARALRVQRESEGLKITHGESLELVAKKNGFENWRACRASVVSAGMTSPPTTERLRSEADAFCTNESERFTIGRKGDVPLRFEGRIIGTAEEQERNNDWYKRTAIYKTNGGKYVAAVVEDANYMERIHRAAEVFEDAAKLVVWLRDEEGRLHSTACGALREAATTDAGIAAAYVEDIE